MPLNEAQSETTPFAAMFPGLVQRDPQALEGIATRTMSTTEITRRLVNLDERADLTARKMQRLIPKNKVTMELTCCLHVHYIARRGPLHEKQRASKPMRLLFYGAAIISRFLRLCFSCKRAHSMDTYPYKVFFNQKAIIDLLLVT